MDLPEPVKDLPESVKDLPEPVKDLPEHNILTHCAINKDKIDHQNILITGGTGSFGQQMVKILLEKFQPNRIIIYSRDEFKQSLMKEQFDS